jgi:lipopolysaccharide transport system ATP-binding protein
MFVRLAFAALINVDPDILIIDESLSVGDMAFQTKCMKKIRRFAESSKTLIFVSHDPSAVKTLCGRAILLDKGVINDQGSPDKVFDYYGALLAINEDKMGDVSEIKIDELRKRVGSRAIEITKVEMKNSKGFVTDTFISGETVSIDITCYSNETIDSPTFGILIRDRLGNDIFGTNNFSMKVDAGKFVKGNNYALRYIFDLNLGPNIYNLTVAAHDGMTHIEKCYDWINSIFTFKVIPSNDFQFIGASRLVPDFFVSELERMQ